MSDHTRRPSKVASPFNPVALQEELGRQAVDHPVAAAVFRAATVPAVETGGVAEMVAPVEFVDGGTIRFEYVDGRWIEVVPEEEPVVKTDSDSVVATPAASKPQANKDRRSSSPRPPKVVIDATNKLTAKVVAGLKAAGALSSVTGWEGKVLRSAPPLKVGASATAVADRKRATAAGAKQLEELGNKADQRAKAAAVAAEKAEARTAKLSRDASELVAQFDDLTLKGQLIRPPQWVLRTLRRPLSATAPTNVVDSYVKGIALLKELLREAVVLQAAADKEAKHLEEVAEAVERSIRRGKTARDHAREVAARAGARNTRRR